MGRFPQCGARGSGRRGGGSAAPVRLALAMLASAALSGCGQPSQPASGGEAVDALQERYLEPRAYPGETIGIAHREAALDHLRQMHQSSAPHLAPGALPAGGSSDCIWKSAGPTNVNGRVTAISIARNQSEVVFVATVGGVWRSTDRARRWQRVLADARPGVFGAVAVDPSGQTVYAGGGDPGYQEAAWGGGPGVWRSSDGGDTWNHEVAADLDRAVVFRLVVDPDDPAHAYAAASTGVWERTGGSWSRLANLSGPCSDIAVDFTPTVPVVYAGIYEDGGVTSPRGVWKYDGTWKMPTYGRFQEGGIIALALAPSDPSTLYAKLQKKNSNKALIVCRTTNAGQTWRKRSSLDSKPDFAWYNSALAVDPADRDVVWLGMVDLHRSTDGGETWQERKRGQFPRPNSISLHVDQHAIAFEPANPSFLYVGNDGGLFRSSDMAFMNSYSENVWHWDPVSHGMVVTEFYRMATRSAPATILGGGTQDNGTALTFGNRTWYAHLGSDGGVVAMDAANILGVYESQDGELVRYGNPVPGRLDWRNTRIPWPSTFADPHDPVATDPALAGHAAAVSWRAQHAPELRFTTDNGLTWQAMPGALPADAFVTALAVAPGSYFNSFYVAYRSRASGAGVRATTNRGMTWSVSTGLPNLSPNAIAVDADDAGRAFVAMGGEGGAAGGIYQTVDGGASWQDVSGSGTTGLPETPMTGVVIDPANDHVVYASSFVGVFKGTLSGTGATWVPFDEGLPEGLDVNDIALNAATHTLTIGTRGYGAYQRSIGPAACPRTQGMIRDNVFDRGEGAAMIGEPNPEDPVDPDSDGRWTGNKGAGAVSWWTSTDIRVVVREPGASTIPDFDHVEFESCPIWAEQCPEGVLRDTRPTAGNVARVFVQVTNPGLTPLTNVRVTALWFGGSIPAPELPANFWNASFGVAPSSANTSASTCGAITSTSGWQYVDPLKRCATVTLVKPGESEIVAFDWLVPSGATGPFQYLALMESAEAPLGAARAHHAMDQLVPPTCQVAMRSLEVSQVVVASAAHVAELVQVVPPGGAAGVEFTVSSLGRDPADEMLLFVPPGAVDFTGATRDTASDTLKVKTWFPNVASGTHRGYRASVIARGTIPGTAPVDLVLVLFPGAVPLERPRQFHVVVHRGPRVYGGMTWVVRTGR